MQREGAAGAGAGVRWLMCCAMLWKHVAGLMGDSAQRSRRANSGCDVPLRCASAVVPKMCADGSAPLGNA